MDKQQAYMFGETMYHQCNMTEEKCQLIVVTGGLACVTAIPVVLFGIVNNILTNIIYRRVNPRWTAYHLCMHAHMVIDVCTLIYGGIISLFLTRGLPWVSYRGLTIQYLNHMGCRIVVYVESFLFASRINLLLMEFVLRIFSNVLDSNGVKSIVFAILSTLLLSANQSVLMPETFGLWQYHSKFICSVDPVHAQLVSQFVLLHHTLFCQGMIPAVAILLFGVLLLIDYDRIQYILYQMQQIPLEHNFVRSIIQTSMERLKRLQGKRAPLLWHGMFVGLFRVLKCSMIIHHIYNLYNPKSNSDNTVRCMQYFYHNGSINFDSLEIVAISLKPVWYYLWYHDIRKFLTKPFRQSSCHRSSASLSATASPSVPSASSSPDSFDMQFYNSMKGILDATGVTERQSAIKWLSEHSDLPIELGALVERTKLQNQYEGNVVDVKW